MRKACQRILTWGLPPHLCNSAHSVVGQGRSEACIQRPVVIQPSRSVALTKMRSNPPGPSTQVPQLRRAFAKTIQAVVVSQRVEVYVLSSKACQLACHMSLPRIYMSHLFLQQV